MHVGLFSTCLVDVMRPTVGIATVQLLLQSGCTVSIPPKQTCCAQPGYNNGDTQGTIKVARQVITMLEEYDRVIAPSGSCLAMISKHYPRLFREQGDNDMYQRALKLASKSSELIDFLASRAFVPQSLNEILHVTYHDSCSGLRELGIQKQARQLLTAQKGVELTEMKSTEVCCGFGGTFCVKNTPISDRMADNKLNQAVATGAEVLLAGDLGCLLHLASRSFARRLPLRLRHVAEILAGFVRLPAIGERGNIDWDSLTQQAIHMSRSR